MAAASRARRNPDPPLPDAVVRFYPNPVDIIRAYVESDFAAALATEHERKVRVLAEEGAEVTDAPALHRVELRLVDVASHRKDVEGWFRPIKDFAYRLHRMICDREAAVLKPLNAFETTAKYQAQAFRRREEEQRREAEQRLADQARREEQERLTREAEQLESRGEHQLAQQVLEEAIHTPAPVFAIASSLEDVKGISYRSNWKWRPIGGDTPQARARAAALVPREYLKLDEVKLNAYAKAHGASARIPGLEFYDAGSVAVRG
jgi:hypothetical protein